MWLFDVLQTSPLAQLVTLIAVLVIICAIFVYRRNRTASVYIDDADYDEDVILPKAAQTVDATVFVPSVEEQEEFERLAKATADIEDARKESETITSLLHTIAEEEPASAYDSEKKEEKSSNIINIGIASRKITDDEVRHLRKMYNAETADLVTLAIKYDVSTTTIRRILKRETYRDVI